MTKLRVYEYAKQLNMSSKEILTILSRLDVPVANHMSVMDDHMVTKVEQFFSDVKQRAAQKHATEVERELREKQRQRERAARLQAQQRQQEARAAETNQGEIRPESTASQGIGVDQRGRTEPARRQPEGGASTGRSIAEGRTETAMSGATPTSTAQPRETGDSTPTAPAAQSAIRETTEPERMTSARPDSGRTRDAGARTDYSGARSPRPGSDTAGQRGAGRPGYAGDRRPDAGGQRRDGRPPYGGSNQGQSQGQSQAGNRGPRPNGGGNFRDNRSASTGGYMGNRDARPNGGFGSGGRPNSGGGRPGGPGGARPGGQGGYGGNRDGNRGGFGGGRDAGSSGFSGSRGGGTGGRSNTGGRPNAGGRPATGLAVASSPAQQQRKDKDKARGNDFDRAKKERFNENKLSNRPAGGRRRPTTGGATAERRRPEYPTKVTVEGAMTVGEFAKLLKREASEIIKKLLFLGIMATINQDIDTDAMELIASEFGTELEVVEPVDEETLDMLVEEDQASDLTTRPPVVTIMGHVDHGKTTLLDAIRESKVTATESGGITQHIGAYQVEVSDRKITFLDTPGHEAFTTMRARGAQVTDICILVVAADDGVMPQTVEAINHAKAASVPIVVAVNKIDKPNANPDRVKQELTNHGLVPEEWGGDTIFAPISALKREGLESLLEMVLLVADVADLKANAKARPRGTVIEAKLDKGRGTVATVLVQNGTLKVGDVVVAGTSSGRVRAMVGDNGKRLKEAGPSTPVEIQGLNEPPSAGDLFVVYDDERSARNLAQKRVNRERAEQLQSTARVTLDDLYRQIQEGNVKELNVIVKADVQGSVEALVHSIEKIEVAGCRVKVIHRGAGAITESDVALASASNAIIVGFHVRPDVNAKRAAEADQVDIRLYRVIYNVIEELESAMKGMLDPEYKEVVLGHADVRQVYTISKIGTVAGCYIIDGKVTRDSEARVIRDGVVVHEGKLDSLKRFKDDVREVATGFECGLTLERFNDLKVGDVVEAFRMEAVKVS